jgi:cation transport ATPase
MDRENRDPGYRYLGGPIEGRTAASDAIDIALLGGDVRQVWQALTIARPAIVVATEGIGLGIGLSILAMLVAAAGFRPPLAGRSCRKGIEVLVTINAPRATTGHLGDGQLLQVGWQHAFDGTSSTMRR